MILGALMMITLLVAGCAAPTAYHWTGGDGSQFKMIDYQCQSDQAKAGGGTRVGPFGQPLLETHSHDNDLYVKCMEAHGYRLRP